MARFNTPGKGALDASVKAAFQAHEDAINRLSDQSNSDPSSAQPATPAQVSSVTGLHANGIHDIAIYDNSPASRGRQYNAYYSQTPDFQNAHKIDMGTSQNLRFNHGSGTLYWGVTSRDGSSPESSMVLLGGSSPTPLGSGAHSGPPMQQAQGFDGPYRGATRPPIRR